MGWWRKFFGGLGLQFSDCTHPKVNKGASTAQETDAQRGTVSEPVNEEVELAVAISLLEQDQLVTEKTETQRETGSKSLDEEMVVDLAVALSLSKQDQPVARRTETQRKTGKLNKISPPFHLVGDGIQSTENRIEECEVLEMNSPPCTCAGCGLKIEHGACFRRLGSLWHPECFKCHSCKKAIAGDFKLSKSKGRFYHKSCYKVRSFLCFVCKDPLPPNAAGRFPHCMHHFWREEYCPSREVDGTAVCCGCERMEQKDVEYLKLDDGRTLCLECLESGTMDTNESLPVYLDVREFFESLHMKIEQDFPLYLVEKQALNHARQEGKLGYDTVVQTRGLCLSEVQTVATVLKGPRSAGDKLVRETVRLVRTYEVTGILILYGLPRLLTGSILAHELMHAWFRLNGFKNLKPYVEEGMCQVLAYMWLKSIAFAEDDPASSSSSSLSSSSSSFSSSSPPSSPSSSSSSLSSSPADTSEKGGQPYFEKKLVELFKKQIEMDPSLDYGDGFRRAIKAVTNHGLMQTLKYIKANNEFP